MNEEKVCMLLRSSSAFTKEDFSIEIRDEEGLQTIGVQRGLAAGN